MNELTYLLAILVHKDVLTLDEARKLYKETTNGITNSNLAEMITKVTKALETQADEIKKIDAKEVLV